MKISMLIIALMTPLFTAGQSIATDWNVKTDSLIQTLLSGLNQFRFNEIVENRKNYEQKLIFDTIFQVLRIQEMFDARTNKFEQNIEYLDSSDADDGLSMAWSYELIDSLKPRCYTIYLGCIIKKGVPQRVKRWKRKINKMNQ